MNPSTNIRGTTICCFSTRPTRVRYKWCLVAPLTRQKQQLPIGVRAIWEDSMNGFLAHDRTHGAFAKLVRRESVRWSKLIRPTTSSAMSVFEKLPVEIIELILHHLIQEQDLIALGSCCALMAFHVAERVRKETYRPFGGWSGTPPVCVCGNAIDPPHTLYDTLIQDPQDDRQISPELRRRDWVHCAFKNYHELPRHDIGRRWNDSLNHMPFEIPAGLKESIGQAITPTGATKRRYWLLRNLSTQEFIELAFTHDYATAEMEVDQGYFLQLPKCVAVKGYSRLSLDVALLSQILWSEASDSFDTAFDQTEERGPWAGHCFGIVPANDLISTQGWNDATKDVITRSEQRIRRLRHETPVRTGSWPRGQSNRLSDYVVPMKL